MHRAKSWPTALVALMVTAGCGATPMSTAPAILPEPSPATAIAPMGSVTPPLPPPERYLAFTACRDDQAGSLFLWDAALQDVFVLNGALAGLGPLSKDVQGPADCSAIAQLNPRAFGQFKVLLSFGGKVFVYDLTTEERITAATDGRPLHKGGPRAVVSSDGKLLAYVSVNDTLVLKPTHPVYATKTRELAKLAAEIAAIPGRKGYGGVIRDLDLSGDGKWLVVNLDGSVYLYDVATPRLMQVLPLDGTALAAKGDGFGHVAISPDGNLVACTIAGRRLLVFDRQRNQVDTVPYATLGDSIAGGAVILDPLFGADGRSLYFEALVGGTFKVWRYDLLNETLRSLVVLDNAMGEDTVDTRFSRTDLGP